MQLCVNLNTTNVFLWILETNTSKKKMLLVIYSEEIHYWLGVIIIIYEI